MSFYAEIAATALEVLQEFGQSVTFTRTTDGAYTPGTAPAQTETTYTATLVVDNYKAQEIDGETVQTGDLKAVVSSTTAPVIGDKAPINGDTYRVQNVMPISPAGEVVVYELQFRR